jgi:hypothetical protein
MVNMSIMVDNDRGTLTFYRNGFMADGTTLTANRVRLFSGTSAYDVVANALAGIGSVRGTYTPAYAPTGASALCVAPPSVCGGPNVFVEAAGPPLAPGAYGIVEVAPGITLTLTSGIYDLCTLRLLPGATLEVATGAAAPTVRITRLLKGARDVVIGPGLGLGRPVFQVGRLSVGMNATIAAHLSAPDGVLRFGRELMFDGTMCARRITAFREAELGCVP